MSSLGQSGNSHPGLAFPQPGSLRRSHGGPGGFPPLQHANPAQKPSPGPHNASPYQQQAYTPQQPPQAQYPHHLFQTPTPVNGNPTPPTVQQQLPQVSQVQQVPQQVQQVQQAQQVPQASPVQQQVQQPAQARPETPAQASEHHGESMEVDASLAEGDDSLEPKMIDGAPFVPRTPMGEMMSAPPEGGSFPTLEAVHKSVLAYCTSVGYAIVIGRSKKTVPGLKKVLFVCDRAGKPPSRVSPEFRKRKTSSRKCDCQFGFFAIEQRTQWTIRYRPDPQHLQHNHGPSESPLLHPAARKLDSKMVAAVKALKENGEPAKTTPRERAAADSSTGVSVNETLEILQGENPHVPLLPRDIYNARAAINRNPQKVATGLAENRPAIYSKPHPTAEERIRADLRKELAKAREDFDKYKEDKQKEVDELKKKLVEKDQIIERFEMFIDICNQRVMVQRERLGGPEGSGNNGT
ncbi:hypothetical protein CSIM01_09934 [Colletotrichum simmondsii]|uniref:Mutator-like element n=1 Tax=Colletotrichum simmondsii TaxID=703756 RepID=A0A135SVY5_9PEZI|nr:hypothetical protein CSIM01_09934 [Colletotrichum simmondsii]